MKPSGSKWATGLSVTRPCRAARDAKRADGRGFVRASHCTRLESGIIDQAQFRWLQRELRANSSSYYNDEGELVENPDGEDKLIIVFTHHTISSTQNTGTLSAPEEYGAPEGAPHSDAATGDELKDLLTFVLNLLADYGLDDAPVRELEAVLADLNVEMVKANSGKEALRCILCEGGPTLHGDLVTHDLVDEVCLTVAPTLTSGDAPRIAHSRRPVMHGMTLGHAVPVGDVLFTRWVRDRT